MMVYGKFPAGISPNGISGRRGVFPLYFDYRLILFGCFPLPDRMGLSPTWRLIISQSRRTWAFDYFLVTSPWDFFLYMAADYFLATSEALSLMGYFFLLMSSPVFGRVVTFVSLLCNMYFSSQMQGLFTAFGV